MDVRLDLIGWSFGSGVFAFFNPCGFAMLPAYVAHYLGSAGRIEGGALRPLVAGLGLGGVVSGGFITVFAVLGLVVSLIGGAIGPILPWAGAAIGVGLIVLGALMLFADTPLTVPALTRLAGAMTPAPGNPHPQPRGLTFYYGYGVTYALASTGCTLPLFMVVVGNAFLGGALNGSAQFSAYALGMVSMMLGLSVLMVYSKTLVAHLVPRLMRAVRWVAGAGVAAAGAYLVYYNLVFSGLVVL